MSEQQKITVVRKSDRDAILRAERDEKRRRELKKIKDELLTLARRVDAVVKESAQTTE